MSERTDNGTSNGTSKGMDNSTISDTSDARADTTARAGTAGRRSRHSPRAARGRWRGDGVVDGDCTSPPAAPAVSTAAREWETRAEVISGGAQFLIAAAHLARDHGWVVGYADDAQMRAEWARQTLMQQALPFGHVLLFAHRVADERRLWIARGLAAKAPQQPDLLFRVGRMMQGIAVRDRRRDDIEEAVALIVLQGRHPVLLKRVRTAHTALTPEPLPPMQRALSIASVAWLWVTIVAFILRLRAARLSAFSRSARRAASLSPRSARDAHSARERTPTAPRRRRAAS